MVQVYELKDITFTIIIINMWKNTEEKEIFNRKGE